MNKKARFALIATVSMPATVFADTPVDDVIAADRAFAAAAGELGAQAAFQQFLADDGVLFRPTAVAGRDWLKTHEEASGRLEWSPSAGAVSCDNQTAITIGPWTYRQGGDVSGGYYLTVWTRDASGRWQVALDHGIDIARPPQAADVAAAGILRAAWSDATAGARCAKVPSGAPLANADRDLNAAVQAHGLDAALRAASTQPLLAMRDEHVPAGVADDWPQDTTALGADVVAVTTAAVASPGSDMGFSYGEIRSRDAQLKSNGEVRAVYVRVWIREGAAWRLVVDLLTPLPQGPADASNSRRSSAVVLARSNTVVVNET